VSGAFAAALRARPRTIRVAPEGVPTISARVQMPEVWDVLRFDVAPTETALGVKTRALKVLANDAEHAADYVLKLQGWEVLDERATLAELGVVDGSILLLTSRRKRPVR
jgi:hypothetical protein